MQLTRAGLRLLVFAAIGMGVHVWIGSSALLAHQVRGEGVRYLFVPSEPAWLMAWIPLALALLLSVHRWVGQQEADWAKPLLLLWLTPLPLLALVPGVGRFLSIVSFVLVDLRWWWTGIVLAATAGNVIQRRGVALNVAPAALFNRRWLPELSLIAVCGVWVVAGTPYLRFTRDTHGDEPKYLRYCENFYQGHGLEISSIQPLASLPSGFRPRFGRNFRLAAEILPGELAELASDVGVFLADPSHRFTRSVKERGFIRKDGRRVPGSSAGSLVDDVAGLLHRPATGSPVPGSTRQWPSKLVAVNTFFLGLYLLWIVLMYRFLRHLAEARSIAWVAALTFGLTLPAAAFPFQFYPEVAAGVLLFAAGAHLVFPERPTRTASFFVGLLVGYLPWLHVRFSALAAVLVAFAITSMRHDLRRLAAFLGGFAVPAVLLALYAYRLTGSILPSAVWSEEDGVVALSALGAIRGSVAYVLDSEWGLLAHSPVYLLALPGYWLLARRRRDLAWLCALVALSVLLPSAAHTLSAAATTPNRLIVAVVPFAAVPLVMTMAHYSRSRAFQAIFLVLLLLSAQTALTYNWWHLKHVGHLIDHSFSGWKVNLLFPGQSRSPWALSFGNGLLYMAWLGLLVIVSAPPTWTARMRWTPSTIPRGMLTSMVALVLLGTTTAAVTGAWGRGDYRCFSVDQARRIANSIEAKGRCFLCVSSHTGPLSAEQVMAELVRIDPALAERSTPAGSARAYDEWLKMPGRIRAWYVEANGHEPSNEDIGHYLFGWREETIPAEEIRRRIFSAANKPVP